MNWRRVLRFVGCVVAGVALGEGFWEAGIGAAGLYWATGGWDEDL